MKNVLNISYFNEIVKGIKGMKSDLVCINSGLLIGTDNTMSNLKIYNTNIFIPLTDCTLIVKELSSEFYANITDTEIVFDFDEGKLYCPNNKSYADNRINTMMTDSTITDMIMYRYSKLINTIHNPCIKIVDYGDITNDEYFQQYKDLKAAEGARLYLPNGNEEYGMYLYNGAIPLNKSDKVSLCFYDEGQTFISKFTVYKKKLNPIDVYFKFVKLNNMR